VPEIEDFGLKPKRECQVGCPVLKDLYDTFKREADSLWKQVDEDKGSSPDVLASMRARAAAYSNICSSLGVIINPRAAAMLLESTCGTEEDQ
jgi:hypothetical protein